VTATYTIPADVTLPSEVGAVVHLAVPGKRCACWTSDDPMGYCDDHTNGSWPPPVLADLVGKPCDAGCDGFGCYPHHTMEWHDVICPACAGAGSALVDLVRECETCRRVRGQVDFELDCPDCVSLGRWKVKALLPVVHFGDWDTSRSAVVLDDVGYAMLAIVTDGIVDSRGLTVHGTPEPGGYVATLELVVAS
jgi:hypothetical protein